MLHYEQAFKQYDDIAKKDEERREQLQQKQKSTKPPEKVKVKEVSPENMEKADGKASNISGDMNSQAKPDSSQPKPPAAKPSSEDTQAKPVETKEAKPVEDKEAKPMQDKDEAKPVTDKEAKPANVEDDEDADPELTRFV